MENLRIWDGSCRNTWPAIDGHFKSLTQWVIQSAWKSWGLQSLSKLLSGPQTCHPLQSRFVIERCKVSCFHSVSGWVVCSVLCEQSLSVTDWLTFRLVSHERKKKNEGKSRWIKIRHKIALNLIRGGDNSLSFRPLCPSVSPTIKIRHSLSLNKVNGGDHSLPYCLPNQSMMTSTPTNLNIHFAQRLFDVLTVTLYLPNNSVWHCWNVGNDWETHIWTPFTLDTSWSSLTRWSFK